MPIVVKAQSGDNTNDLIRKFKKITAEADVVTKARERKYYKKPSQARAANKILKKRLSKRARKLKKMKNITDATVQRIRDRIT